MTTLLVASAGGHLEQLRALVDRFTPPIRDRLWVTYDRLDAHELLGGEELVAGHGPSTRHLGNAVRNTVLASRLLRSRDIHRVISTGAGIAVPFLAVARLHGIPAHYIESFTRVRGPSLSGRMLQRVPGVRLYTQHPRNQTQRWRHAGSVVDGFRALRSERPDRPLRFVVALGSHPHGFGRLIERMQQLVGPDEEVVWQLGATGAESLPGEAHELLPPGRLAEMLSSSDVVVCHAGVGLARMSLMAGRRPVLVPRRAERGEHVDDHQVQLAEHLHERAIAIHAEVDELHRGHLREAARTRIVYESPGAFRLQD